MNLTQKYKRNFGKGWWQDSFRHKLAAKGIKTSKKKFHAKRDFYKKKVIDHYEADGIKIPITVRPTYKSHVYPVTVDDVKESLDKVPAPRLKGLKEISFRPPSRLPFTEQTKAWAQYADKADRVNIYSEPFKVTKAKGFRYKRAIPDFDEYHELNAQMKNYVIPHEIAHHYALDHMGFKNDTQEQAEARANFYMKQS